MIVVKPGDRKPRTANVECHHCGAILETKRLDWHAADVWHWFVCADCNMANGGRNLPIFDGREELQSDWR